MADGYTKFRAMANRNALMEEVPTHDKLIIAGYDVKPNGYIVGDDGREWNPALVNPDILPEQLQQLFGYARKSPLASGAGVMTDRQSEPPEEPDGTGETETEQDSGESHPETAVCTDCYRELPVEAFRKFRGNGRASVCKECQKKKRQEDRKKLSDDKTPPVLEEKPPSGWISIEQAKVHVRDAYGRGYEDGKKDAIPEETEVTLDELLEVADER